MSSIEEKFRKSVHGPHNAAFQAAFQKREIAGKFFRHYFPEEIVKLMDLRTLKLANRSFVDEEMKTKHSDIVYSVRIRGKKAYLYILFEHQSTPDYWMAFRLLCYMANIWREFIAQNPEKKKLPIVLPAVLYHGKDSWNAPRSFMELIEDGEGFEKYIPEFSYDLYNLGDYEDERLLLGDAMALGVVLYLMKHIYDDDFGERFVEAAAFLGKIDDEKTLLEFLELMLRYAYNARDDDGEYIERGLDALKNEKARRLAMTIAERLRQEGLEQGRLIAVSILLKQLKKRFGNLSPILEQKLHQSESDLLDHFGESIFDFKDVKDAENWWDKYEKHGNA